MLRRPNTAQVTVSAAASRLLAWGVRSSTFRPRCGSLRELDSWFPRRPSGPSPTPTTATSRAVLQAERTMRGCLDRLAGIALAVPDGEQPPSSGSAATWRGGSCATSTPRRCAGKPGPLPVGRHREQAPVGPEHLTRECWRWACCPPRTPSGSANWRASSSRAPVGHSVTDRERRCRAGACAGGRPKDCRDGAIIALLYATGSAATSWSASTWRTGTRSSARFA